MSEESEHPAEATEAPVTDVETETLSEVVTTEAPKVKRARSQKQIDALNTAREKLTKKRKDAEMDELFRQRKVQEEINTLLSTNKQMREELELAKAKEMKTKKKRKKTTYVSSDDDDDISSSEEEERIEKKKRKRKTTSKPQGNTVVPSNLVLRSLGF